MLIFVAAFEAFWLAAYVGIALYKDEEIGTSTQHRQNNNNGTVFLWVLFHIFYSLFFEYCLVFLIGTACAIWYYNLDQNFIFIGTKRIIRYHLGSFTFATFIISVVAFLRQTADNEVRENRGACACCWCCMSCCLRCFEGIL